MPLICSPFTNIVQRSNYSLFLFQDYIAASYIKNDIDALITDRCLLIYSNGIASSDHICSYTHTFICKGPSGRVQSSLCKCIILDFGINNDGGHVEIDNNNDGNNNSIDWSHLAMATMKTTKMSMMLMMPVTISVINGNWLTVLIVFDRCYTPVRMPRKFWVLGFKLRL